MRPTAIVALVACLVMGTVLGCLAAPSPAQQAQTFSQTEQCVADHWGEPVLQVAADCFAGELQSALDVIADVELIFEKSAPAGDAGAAVLASFPYKDNPEIIARLAARRGIPR